MRGWSQCTGHSGPSSLLGERPDERILCIAMSRPVELSPDAPVRTLLIAGTEADAVALADGLKLGNSFAVESADSSVSTLKALDDYPAECVITDQSAPSFDDYAVREFISGQDNILLYVRLVDGDNGEQSWEYDGDLDEVLLPSPPHDQLHLLGGFIRSIVERRLAGREFQHRSDLHQLLGEIIDEVMAAPTQQATIESVCDGLVTSDYFDGAWITGRPPMDQPRVTAGWDRERVERLETQLNDGDMVFPWKEAGRGRPETIKKTAPISPDGDQCESTSVHLASVPLQHRGIIYGVLTVTRGEADEERAISMPVDILTPLGKTVGHALATAELQTQGETFQGAIEAAEPAIAIIDEAGTIEYVNASFEAVYGYTKSEAVGSSAELLVPDAIDSSELLDQVRDGASWHEEILHQRNRGGQFHADLSVAAVPVEGGTRLKFVAVATDITPLKERGQRLQVLNRVLRHNLRNDLNVIQGYVELAADSADERVAELLENALETTADLMTTAETSRNFQRTFEKATPQAHDLSGTIETIANRAKETYPEAVVRVSVPTGISVSATDGLTDALWELLENACVHGRSPVEITAENADETVVVEIADRGPGIPAHELSVIEAGEETALEHGSGLGLWFAQWVVRASSGHLSFETEQGTKARVTLEQTQM